MFCAIMTLVLLNGNQWTFSDLKSIKAASKTCERTYSSCLKKLTKKAPKTYIAICE